MNFEDIVGLVADTIGLCVFAYAAWRFWQAKREYEARLRQLEKHSKGQPCMLVIDVMGTDITDVAKKYLRDAKGLADIPTKTCRHNGVTQDNFHSILSEVRKAAQYFTEIGASEVHLFYRGTITLAAGIGAVVSNWFPTHLYNFEGGTYIWHAVIEKGIVKGLVQSDVAKRRDEMQEV